MSGRRQKMDRGFKIAPLEVQFKQESWAGMSVVFSGFIFLIVVRSIYEQTTDG